ncbi:MAG: molybdenum cofactor biosynthesis protein MoaE [Euryarchaeota archaeon]|nr:molybdenum cofactor biosynthesis protein MoaE [Euryarchaeota archaeon]
MILVTKDDFSVDEILRKVKGERTGAVVAFVGVVRGEEEGRRIRRMEMEAYEEMAERELASLRQRAMEEFGLEDAVIIHRIGPLAPGDNIVLIVVSSAHRKEAFAGAQFLIDELKKVVPLWKKEFHAGGEEWVEG